MKQILVLSGFLLGVLSFSCASGVSKSARWDTYKGCAPAQCQSWYDECESECINRHDIGTTECSTKCKAQRSDCDSKCTAGN